MEPEAEVQVPFGDLKRQYEMYSAEYDAAAARVMARGWFVLGTEGEQFESEWADWVGAPYAVSCNSGTDAIQLALLAHGVKPGGKVVTVANTCVPTVAAIGSVGAQIVLTDVNPDNALMDPEALKKTLAQSGAKAVVAVHLYGQPVDLDPIDEVASKAGAVVIQDAAQAHGAIYNNRRLGGHGGTVAWSFYPSKNLGAFGDGGAITTHSAEVAQRLKMLRNYGQQRRYVHAIEGINSRLDELQAAILRCRLPRLEPENDRRAAIAKRYREELTPNGFRFLSQCPGTSCNHLFPLVCEDRTALQESLRSHGVETLIHYPTPVHLQPAYAHLGYSHGDFPGSETLCASVLSLPMYPELTDEEVGHVIHAVNAAAKDR